MKKILKKIDFKVLATLAILLVFEAAVYFFSKLFLNNLHIIGCEIDKRIPFIPAFIYIYISWYIALFAIPYYIYLKRKESFFKYITTYLISTIVCGIIFIIYPNTIERITNIGNGFTTWIVKVIYFFDTPINCFPSIHCLYSFLFVFAVMDTRKETQITAKLAISIYSIAVVFSTFFVKQHVIYDALGSLIIAIFTWIVVDKFKIYKIFFKRYTKTHCE